MGSEQRLAIFASGVGSNAAQIIKYFKGHPSIRVAAIFSNNPKAKVGDIALENNLPFVVINREEFKDELFLKVLEDFNIDLIVLAGFLWLLPSYLIKAFPKRIINIHPALLPKYGGKGMYGKFVHEAVKRSGDTVTGITIHYVDEHYDRGDIIAQYEVRISPDDSTEDITRKVRELEHRYYAREIERLLGDQT